MEKRLVLIADDEEEILEVLKIPLEKKGFSVVKAENGREAFDLILNDYVDLAIIDIRMPHGSGIDLLRDIKTIPKEDRPIVLIVTGQSDLTEEEALEEGAFCYIHKPFKIKNVMKHVDKAVKELGA